MLYEKININNDQEQNLQKIVSRIYDPFRYSFRYKYDDNISYVQGNE